MHEYGPVVIARPPRLLLTTILVIAASITVLTVLLGSHYGPQSDILGTVIGQADLDRYGIDKAALGAVQTKAVVFQMPMRYMRKARRPAAVMIALPELSGGTTRYVAGDIVRIENMSGDEAGRETAANDRYQMNCLALAVFRSQSIEQRQIDATPMHSIVTVRISANAFGWPSFHTL